VNPWWLNPTFLGWRSSIVISCDFISHAVQRILFISKLVFSLGERREEFRVLLVLVKICHIMTQRCFMLCTTYTNFWSIICPLEVRCLTPVSCDFISHAVQRILFISELVFFTWGKAWGVPDDNYLCNRCVSPLKLWVWTPLMARCTR
jgi:hypothetical protein